MNQRTKLALLTLAGIAATFLAAFVMYPVFNTSPTTSVRIEPTYVIDIEGAPLNIEVVSTIEDRMRGLSGTTFLAPDEGMLFVFEEDDTHGIWMKEMLFAIDIVWLSADGTIVHIAPSVSPDTYPQVFTPPLPARYVLEVPAGFAEEHGIGVGSKLEFSL